MRLPAWLSQHLAALRALLVLTVIFGLAYPLGMLAIAQLPGLRDAADGSLVTVADKTVGSRLIGQAFTNDKGEPLKQYFQSRPGGYDPAATGASNLGPESVVDTLPGPGGEGTPSLLTLVCARSKAAGELEGVDGSRPYCTSDGVGAVLAVFHRDGLTGPVTRAVSLNQACPSTPFVASYQGVNVECAKFGEDYSHGLVTPIRGTAPADPTVPADAVTASGSGLDPHISPAYADLQATRIAKARGTTVDEMKKLIDNHTDGRTLGFLGEPTVNVLELNIDLDRQHPFRG